MPIELPTLDKRGWEDLVAEARGLIPLFAPEWTNHNPTDPGITLVELLAWALEQEIFRADQVTPRHRRAFLSLLGYHPAPPQPARIVLAFATSGGASTIRVPGGTVVTTTSRLGKPLPFVTQSDVDVTAAQVEAIAVGLGERTLDRTSDWLNGRPIEPFGPSPAEADVPALYVGLDQAPDPAWAISLWFTTADPSGVRSSGERAVARRAPVSTRWDAYLETAAGEAEWTALEPPSVEDETNGLTVDGAVRLATPAERWTPRALPDVAGAGAGDYCWLRCRLAAGQYDAAPALTGIALNAVAATQVTSVARTRVGTVHTVAAQTISLPVGPDAGDGLILPDRPPVFEISTEQEGQASRQWALVDDLATAAPGEYAVQLDVASHTIRFGDGQCGAPAPLGSAIRAAYRVTAGPDGNIGSRATWSLPGDAAAALQATNPAPAAGGSDGETLDSVARRAYEDLLAHERLIEATKGHLPQTLDLLGPAAAQTLPIPLTAQTTLDVERLALTVPGTHVARARAWSGVDPRYPGRPAANAITVAVIPWLPAGRPSPTQDLRETVWRYLDERRLIGTRIWVVAPRYAELSIRVTVSAVAGVDRSAVTDAVRSRLDVFLDPLAGGMGGDGWPFGYPLCRSQLLSVLEEVPGVARIVALTAQRTGPDTSEQYGDIPLATYELTTPGKHEVTVQ